MYLNNIIWLFVSQRSGTNMKLGLDFFTYIFNSWSNGWKTYPDFLFNELHFHSLIFCDTGSFQCGFSDVLHERQQRGFVVDCRTRDAVRSLNLYILVGLRWRRSAQQYVRPTAVQLQILRRSNKRMLFSTAITTMTWSGTSSAASGALRGRV